MFGLITTNGDRMIEVCPHDAVILECWLRVGTWVAKFYFLYSIGKIGCCTTTIVDL